MQTTTTPRFMLELDNLPEADYPQEVIERWDKEAEVTKLKIATGEYVPLTMSELAAKHGLRY